MSSRRHFLSAGTGAFASIGFMRYASAAEYTLKYSNDIAATHPVSLRSIEMAEKVKHDSGGRLEIHTFPDNALGGTIQQLTQLRSGAIDLMHAVELSVGSLVPVASMTAIGFAFNDYRVANRALDADLGAFLRASIEPIGLHVFDRIWYNGFRQTTSSTHPIASPSDLKGFKIRVPVAPLSVSLFKALGASPTPINFNEIYTALQTKIVEGQETPLVVIETSKVYEVQKYLSMTNHQYAGYYLMMNADSWKRLPKDLQDILARNIHDAAVLERGDVERQDESLLAKLKTQGLTANTIDPVPFRRVLRESGFYSDWKKTYGDRAWTLLEKYTGPLA